MSVPVHISCRKLEFSWFLFLGQIQFAFKLSKIVFPVCAYMLCVCSCVPVSVRLPVRAANWFARVRDAVPLLHRPALCPGSALCPPHPAAVHPQRDQHSEIHQVRCPMSHVRLHARTFNCLSTHIWFRNKT